MPELEPSYYGFTEADLNRQFNVGSFRVLPTSRPVCARILEAVRQTYGSIGSGYIHLGHCQKRWIQARLESIRGFYPVLS